MPAAAIHGSMQALVTSLQNLKDDAQTELDGIDAETDPVKHATMKDVVHEATRALGKLDRHEKKVKKDFDLP